MKTTHKDIEIEYLERENVWQFTLRGRERRVGSLAKAKEAIDAPVKEKNGKEFTRIPAWRREWGSGWERGEITSLTDRAYSSGGACWFQVGKNRLKRDISDLYSVTPENDALIAEWNELSKQKEELTAKQQAIESKVKKVTVEMPE